MDTGFLIIQRTEYVNFNYDKKFTLRTGGKENNTLRKDSLRVKIVKQERLISGSTKS